MGRILNSAKDFAKNTSGNVAIMFALSAIPLFIGAGAAIDFGRYVAVNSQMNAALDSASIAAASMKGATDAQRTKTAQDTFKQNMAGGAATGLTTTASFVINGTAVQGEAHSTMTTLLMNIVGVNNLDVAARNQVGIGGSKKAEIAFVLDYSGSMADPAGGQIKYIAMGQAATKLIDTLTATDPTKVKFGLVPFSQAVYVTLPAADVKGAAPGTWTGCTQDRMYPYNLSDAAPNPLVPASQWGQVMVSHPWKSSCNDYVNNHLIVRPLTNDFAGLKAQIAQMQPYQNTHVALGAEFGYQMLSPNGAFTGATAYSDTGTVKFMVLLTDGMQTEPAFGPGGSRTVSQGDTNLEKICGNAKASGITVITLAYDLSDTTQRQRLQNCASDPSADFFVVNSGQDVAKAFEAITAAITDTVYLSK
jgi:Flp pilus assembly protein TadG